MVVNGLAPILAPIIGGQLLHLTTWRGVFLVLGIIGVALFVTGALGLPETLPTERRRTGGIGPILFTFRRLFEDRIFVGYSVSSGLALAAMFAYIAGSPFVLEEIYRVSPQGFSMVFATNALGIMATSQVSSRLVGRVSPRGLLATGLGACAAGGLLLLLSVLSDIGLPGILPALFLVVASIGLIAPNATALALADHARSAGSASALLGVLQYIVGGAVAPLVGIGGTGTALPMAVIIALSSSGAMVAFVFLTRTSAPSPAA
jgi:DHA1 family bicyclomycin/chloramphenicol resistance-like MFS transporter